MNLLYLLGYDLIPLYLGVLNGFTRRLKARLILNLDMPKALGGWVRMDGVLVRFGYNSYRFILISVRNRQVSIKCPTIKGILGLRLVL